MRREYRKNFPRHWLQRKPLVSYPGMRHGTYMTAIWQEVHGLLIWWRPRTCLDACRDRWPAVARKTLPASPAHAHPAILRIWQAAHGPGCSSLILYVTWVCHITSNVLYHSPNKKSLCKLTSLLYVNKTFRPDQYYMSLQDMTINTSRPRQIGRLFQTTFSKAFSWMKMKNWISIKISLKFDPSGSNWHHSGIGSGNGFAPTRRQAIVWTNDA